jgi:hypothetical protein
MKIKIEKDKLKLWSFVCVLSAAPSFYWALEVKANIPAVIVGVLLFIIAYTIATSSDFYKKLEQKSFLFKALEWAFRVRVFYSFISLPVLLLPVLRAIAVWVNLIDFWFGLISIIITEFLLGKNSFIVPDIGSSLEKDFLPTLLTTITQGVLLSLAVFLLAVMIWLFFRIKQVIFSRHPVRREATAQDLERK